MNETFKHVSHSHVPLFANVKEKDWNDWKWQLKNAIRDIKSLKKVINISEGESRQIQECLKKFKMAITPYYACLMDKKYKIMFNSFASRSSN